MLGRCRVGGGVSRALLGELDDLGELNERDFEALEAAALLHDIGYAPELVDTAFIRSTERATWNQSPRRSGLVALVAHHSAARQDAEMRGLADYLDAYEDEQSAARVALWWADMATGLTGR